MVDYSQNMPRVAKKGYPLLANIEVFKRLYYQLLIFLH